MNHAQRNWHLAAWAAMLCSTTCVPASDLDARSDDTRDLATLATKTSRAYRAAGFPWVKADLLPKNYRSTQNAWPLLQKAGISPGNRPFPMNTQEIQTLLDQGATQAAAKLFEPFSSHLEFALKASQKPYLDFGYDWDMSAVGIAFPQLASMKSLVKTLCLRAEVEAKRGQPSFAVRDLVAAKRLAILVGQGPTVIAMLVDAACLQTVLNAIQWCASALITRPAALHSLETAIPAAAELPSFDRALYGESYYGLTILRNTNEVVSAIRKEQEAGAHRIVETSWLARTGLPKGLTQRAYATRHFQAWLEAKPAMDRFKDQPLKLQAVLAKIADERSAKRIPSLKNVAATFSSFKQLGTPIAELQAETSATRALLHAMLSHLNTGRWPTRISQIHGSWSDPFTGRPLLLKQSGDTIRIYSVGPNLKDDGGIRSSEITDDAKKADYDVVASYPPRPLRG